MLINKELVKAINEQIGREFHAKLRYVNTAAYFDSEDLPQLAAFFYQQSQDEDMHAMKFVHFLVDAGGRVQIPIIDQNMENVDSALQAAQLALDWEIENTNQINRLMDLAVKENDHITQDFLRWFETEQLEEVSTMETLLNTIRRASDNLLLVEQFLVNNPLGNPNGLVETVPEGQTV
ncbi:MAG: ferritin [Anaerolineales bacterium]